MKTIHNLIILTTLMSALSVQPSAFSQGTAFTYQGRLIENGLPVNRTYDLIFRPWNAPTGGAPLTVPYVHTVEISNGLFTTTLDFGSGIFNGSPLWLEIQVSTNGFGGIVATLAPRQPLTPAPYAIFAAGAALANGQVDTPQLASGAVTSAKVADGTLQPADLNLGAFEQTFWKVGGNSGTSSDFIGTTDDQPFDVRVNNSRVMRYRLATDGEGNYANAPNVIGGSSVNSATTLVVGATIAGGGGNFTNGLSFIDANKVTADFGTVGGGLDNTASGDDATVGGGYGNTASGNDAIVSGGYFNTANGNTASVVGGNGNVASGYTATVCGGYQNTATGESSLAAGTLAGAHHNGSFVWADDSFFSFSSTTANQFRVRATGGVAFVTGIDGSGNVTAGVHLLSGDTSWSSISDRNQKKNFAAVDAEAVLEKLAAIPVQQWNYKWESDTATPHLGPMAQDFKDAFYPGRDDKSISTLEFDGVELAAIQGLNQKLEEQRQQLRQKETEITKLKQKNDSLERRLGALEKTILNQKSN